MIMRSGIFGILLPLVLALGPAPEAEAQLRLGADVRLGPKGGLSFGTEAVESNLPDDVFSYRTGVALGAAIEFPLTKRFRLQIEPSYVQRGAELDWGAEFDGLRTVVLVDYVALSALAKVAFEAGPLAPYVMAGPGFASLVSERGYDSVTGETRSYDDLVRDTDVTAEIEAGVEVPMGIRAGTTLSLGARYSHGIANISPLREGSVRSRGVLVLAGVLLRL